MTSRLRQACLLKRNVADPSSNGEYCYQLFYHYNARTRHTDPWLDYERLFISSIHTTPGGTHAKYAKETDLQEKQQLTKEKT